MSSESSSVVSNESLKHFVKTFNFFGFKDNFESDEEEISEMVLKAFEDLLLKFLHSTFVLDSLKKKQSKGKVNLSSFFASLVGNLRNLFLMLQFLKARTSNWEVKNSLQKLKNLDYVQSVLQSVNEKSLCLVELRNFILPLLEKDSESFIQNQLKFFAEIFSIVVSFIELFGSKSFRVENETAQKLLALAFIFDDKKLFKICCNFSSFVFCCQDLFNWDELLFSLLSQREEFPEFFDALFNAKLKSRIRVKLDKDLSNFAKINQPLPANFISPEIVATSRTLFGNFAARCLIKSLSN